MSRTSLCIQMLEILSTGRVYKISELADMLEASPRNIIEYRKELECAGYNIITIPGKYGGYRLDNKNILPQLRFTSEEKYAINEGYKFLLSKGAFLNKKAFELAIAKVMASYDNTSKDNDLLTRLEKEESIFSEQEVEKIYNLLKKAISKRLCCEIEYLSNKDKPQKRTIKPYDLYIYNENWFVIAECVELKRFSYFKLSRIKEIELTNKRFSRDYFYKKSDYLDAEGFKKNDEWFDIKLEISGYFVKKIKEKKIGKNQKIEMIGKDKALLSVMMQYKFNIISFVMSLGSLCKVIEPLWLKEQVKKISLEMQNIYKGEEDHNE